MLSYGNKEASSLFSLNIIIELCELNFCNNLQYSENVIYQYMDVTKACLFLSIESQKYSYFYTSISFKLSMSV